MVSINYSAREVCCKIVYYGPGLSGKTTNLQYIHSKVPQGTRGKLISLATEADRTLYFDFLPINIGTINDFQAKFQLYTVPGQVYYNATRKLVLRGVDGLVFVADSQPDKMDENIESLANLEDNLVEYGYERDELPLVIQYNKRDLPGVMSVADLNARLNQKGRPFFEASATEGTGVFDTLKLIIRMVLERAKSSGSAKVKVAPAPGEASSEPVEKRVSAEAAMAESQPITQPKAVSSVAGGGESVAAEEVDDKSEVAYRPYPGSDRQKQFRANIPESVVTEDEPEPNASNDENDTIAAEAPAAGPLGSPQMAPSLRRRAGHKKRGFLKRLFGIK